MSQKQKQQQFLLQVKRDFRVCLGLIWKYLLLPPPTPIQKDIANYLQAGPKRKLIQAYRGAGKSWITSAFVLWSLLNDPQKKFMVVSASKQRADDFSTFCHRLITTVPVFYHLEPQKGQRESKISWDVGPAQPAHAPSVKSVGIYGQMTGSRATDIIADDIEVPGNSATQDMREKLLTAVTEFEAIIMPGQDSRVTMLGTPQSEETVYDGMRQKGYSCRIWPARVPEDGKQEVYKGELAPKIQQMFDEGRHWEPVDPDRFTDDDLNERQLSYGNSGFMLQFMLDTSLSDQDRYPLKLKDLIVMNLDTERAPITVQYGSGADQVISGLRNLGFSGDRFHAPLFYDKEHWAEYDGSMLFIDPSGRGSDETGYAVVKQLHGKLFVTDAGGFRGGYDEGVLIQLAKIAAENKVNSVTVESNFSDGMFSRLFQPYLMKYWKCGIEETRATQQKEARIIENLEPVLNQHRLIINRDIIERELNAIDRDPKSLVYSLCYQLTRLTRERGALKHDDRLDALAGAVELWMDSMAQDEKEAASSWQTDQLEAQAEDFLSHVLGLSSSEAGSMSSHNWLSTI